jgi:hypothetical protein
VNQSLLALVRESQLPLQLSWSIVLATNLNFCIDWGLERRLICRIALRYRDEHLLHHAHLLKLPWGKLLLSVGECWDRAPGILHWAMQAGWRPTTHHIVKLVLRPKQVSTDQLNKMLMVLEMGMRDTDRTQLPDKIEAFLRRANTLNRYSHEPSAMIRSTMEIAQQVQRCSPGALEWLLTMMPYNTHLRQRDCLFALQLLTHKLTVPFGIAFEHVAEQYMHTGNVLGARCLSEVIALVVDETQGTHQNLEWIIGRIGKDRDHLIHLLYNVALHVPKADIAERLWRAIQTCSSQPATAPTLWNYLGPRCNVEFIRWLRGKGLQWHPRLISQLIHLDRVDLLLEVTKMGCTNEQPLDFVKGNRLTANRASTKVLAFFQQDARWTRWMPFVSMQSAFAAGRCDWVTMLHRLGVRPGSTEWLPMMLDCLRLQVNPA